MSFQWRRVDKAVTASDVVGEHGAEPGAGIRIGAGGDGGIGAEYAIAGEIEELDAIGDVWIIELTVEVGGRGEGSADLEEGAVEEGVEEGDGGSDGGGSVG